MTKYCNKCKSIKDTVLWSKNRSTKDGLSTQCKACMKENAKDHYSRNKQKVNARNIEYYKKFGKFGSLLLKYRVSKSQYQELLIKAKGQCQICNEKFRNKEPYLDHCHKTNKVRGLLCNSCNVGLARFKDNILLLNKAKEYLKLYE